MSAQRPWLSRVADLKDNTLYRPGTLNRVKAQLDSLNPTKFGLGQVAEGNSQFTMHQVKRGDQLRALARDLLGDPEKADLVFQAKPRQTRLPRPHLPSVNWTYDTLGRITQEKKTTSGVVYTVNYTYDADGNIAQITYPSGRIVNYSRDSLGHISGVTTEQNSSSSAVTLASSVVSMSNPRMSEMFAIFHDISA